MRRREHRGCGISNPFTIWMWVAYAIGLCISWPVLLLTRFYLVGLFGLLGYLPWLAVIAASIRWEQVHSPEKMYRTWWP